MFIIITLLSFFEHICISYYIVKFSTNDTMKASINEKGMVKTMKVWLLCNDYYHSSNIVIPGLAPLKDHGVEFTITTDTTDFPYHDIPKYDVIILAKTNENTPELRQPWQSNEVQNALIHYVEGGGGLLVLHSGITGYSEETKELYDLIGCSFDFHPAQCPVTINPIDTSHPIMQQVNSYVTTDEHYHIRLIAKDMHVLFETVSEHGSQIGGYVRTQGNGRICVLTPGHNIENWLADDYQRILFNALVWCKGA